MEPLPLFSSARCSTPDTCTICLARLDEQQTTTLQPCGHPFHTMCIVQWFRSGVSRCPLCNDVGRVPRDVGERYKLIRAYSRKKDAPPALKSYVRRLKKSEQSLAYVKSKIRALRQRTGVFGALLKEQATLKRRERYFKFRICRYRRLIGSLDITPIIIDL